MFRHRLLVIVLCILDAFFTIMGARAAEDSERFTDTQMSCVQQSYEDFIAKGVSDIDVMERCNILTSKQIRFALNLIMTLRVHGETLGTTPFKEAHCRLFYAGYECEYKAIIMQIVLSR